MEKKINLQNLMIWTIIEKPANMASFALFQKKLFNLFRKQFIRVSVKISIEISPSGLFVRIFSKQLIYLNRCQTFVFRAFQIARS